ncbi:chaperone protein DnaJ isoform X1 [Lepeophtheirus salmonis]|uniref:chaperone protein DnaJ isoform X1 n=1 Tax=Lepeophtheirus salmonis TaxID=72036 RepID=UPI001AE9CC56|nr:protein tumorous imaginal discs, mitochondrial-like [Lepeophtheirus salmonis]
MLAYFRLAPRGIVPLTQKTCGFSYSHKIKCKKEEHFLPDYYYILRVNRTSSTKEIKKAYFDLAKKYHPDNNETWEGRHMFLLVAEAYEILTDELKRQQYDEYGSRSSTKGGETAQGPHRASFDTTYDSEELYNKIYGKKARGKDFTINQDYNPSYELKNLDSTYEYKADINFEEAVLGTKFPIELRFKGICPYCQGSKSARGYTGNICPFCEGTGTETERIGHTATRKACSYCNGSRIYIKYKCTQCYATGVYLWVFKHNVIIPPGTESGQVLKIPVHELVIEHSVSAVRNFYVYITVKPSTYFTRDGLDLHSKAPISVPQALLGGKIKVKGMHREEEEVVFEPGQRRVILPNAGVRRSDGRCGSHVVDLILDLSQTQLSESQEELIKQFSFLSHQDYSGTINGIDSLTSHKYDLGIVEPNKVEKEFAFTSEHTTNKEVEKRAKGFIKSIVNTLNFRY